MVCMFPVLLVLKITRKGSGQLLGRLRKQVPAKMVVGNVSNEIISNVSATRLWKSLVKDSHNLVPKILPDVISNIVVVEGDGGVGTIVQTDFNPIVKDFSYWKTRVDAIDDEKYVLNYSIIEGGLLGKKLKSTSFELKFEVTPEGATSCKLFGKYDTIEDRLPLEEEESKGMVEGMVGMFKAVESYLQANPDAYV